MNKTVANIFNIKTRSGRFFDRRTVSHAIYATLVCFCTQASMAQNLPDHVHGMDLGSASRYAKPTNYDPIRVRSASSGAGTFNSGVIFLADQIDRNVQPDVRNRPTVITTFADLNNLGESSNLGRLVGEHLLHELQVRDWNVTDIRLTRDLIVNESGEFSLSRDMKLLRENFPLANVVTGTYSTTRDGIVLNLRVIDSQSGRVLSSAQTLFVKDLFISDHIEKPATYPTIRLRRMCPESAPCGANR